MGAGAIGCFVGGHLANGGADVVFVGRPRAMKDVDDHGLTLVDNARSLTEKAKTATSPRALADVDVVLVAVKSGATADVAVALRGVIARDAVVVSLQNGMGNAAALRAQLAPDRVLGGVVGFNVVTEGAGRYRRTTSGLLAIERSPIRFAQELYARLEDAGFDVDVAADIRAVQWSKLVMNLNNAVSALTDAPTVQLIFEARYRRIVAAVMGEAVAVFKAAGVKPRRLGPLPVTWFPALLSLPTPLVKVLARAQIKIDPEARSSMWEDLQRRRLTEVEELNGEIVRLAASCGAKAPLSAAICALVHEAERKSAGSPQMTADDLWLRLQQHQS
jgi:2-dehydropantoate 2-reductase